MKRCKTCGTEKPEAEFRTYHAHGGTGRRGTCTDCERAGRRKTSVAPPTPAPSAPPKPDLEARLFQATARRPRSFEDLCNELDVSPARLRASVDACRAAGRPVRVEGDFLHFATPEPDEHIQDTGVAPVVGERQQVGVISDLHYGSKYCLREYIRDCVEYMYVKGVRDVLVPGDVVDGNYTDHGLFELSHVGLADQARDVVENLPAFDGLTYHVISGNHDETFMKQNGADALAYVSARLREDGRKDFKLYGHRGAFLRVRGAVVHLWHPMGGGSYARSYKLQKKVEGYALGEKPNILLAGHWHQFCYVDERGVHAISCPTFQGGGSNFGKALTGAPSIGGLLLSWDCTRDGTLRNFVLEKRTYFEREMPQEVK